MSYEAMKNKATRSPWTGNEKLSRIIQIVEGKKEAGDFLSLDGLSKILDREDRLPPSHGNPFANSELSIIKRILKLAGVHYSQSGLNSDD